MLYALLLYVSAYFGHHQVQRVFTIRHLFMSAIPLDSGQCLHIVSVWFLYVSLVLRLCYKMYYILKFLNVKIL
jgi:hypothetical protein